MFCHHRPLTLSIIAFLLTGTACLADVRVVDVPATPTRNRNYTNNREPLAVSPLVKLPIGSIVPEGWLRRQLEMEKAGMVGHLAEISPWLNFDKSSWADKLGRGHFGWEELPYWLKGYGDLGYVLKDETIIADARKWIKAIMDSQREDGWFGPRESLTSLNGKPDLWPHMLVLNILQSYHEATGDPRAVEVMTGFMRWENQLPETAFGEGYWPKLRAGDNIESAFWLYNRSGEPWLLDLARKIHRGMARWDRDVVDWHNVNIAQGFRAGTVFGMLSKEDPDLNSAERNYETVMDRYGQQPGGGFVGDENCRPGRLDPRGGFETCGIVEFMHSFEMLSRIGGSPLWADRCEEIAMNTFPASMTSDEKGLHYITSVNQVQLDRNNKSPGIQNSGTMFSYSPGAVYRCCQHNVSHGWPYYAEEMWLATADNGLCASLYAPSHVTAKVAEEVEVSLREETGYPFRDKIEFKLTAPQAVRFPFYLRVPEWCKAASVWVNGTALDVKARPLSYIVLDRTWKDGDLVTLQLSMQIAVRRWPKNQDAASVSYGPLSFSLAIKERWQRYGDPKTKWPDWEVFPDSAWNYGLVLDAHDPAKSLEIVRRPGEVPLEPFTPGAAPIAMKTKARKIVNWQMDRNQMVGPLQRSPVRSAEPVEEIRLIPLGAARLRIGMFPVIGDGPDAHDWVAPATPKSPSPATPPRAEHPRPDMFRENWMTLNGPWQFEIDRKGDGEARGLIFGKDLAATIIVPFCPESKLSGLGLGNSDYFTHVWYRRMVELPEKMKGKRILLHFGGVDYKTWVYVNGKLAGTHTGENAAFTFEITHLLKEGPNELVVRVFDDLRSGLQPGGKQAVKKSEGCVYTRTTGIWQPVWLEAVGSSFVESFSVVPDPDHGRVLVEAAVNSAEAGMKLTVEAFADGHPVGSDTAAGTWRNQRLVLNLSDKRLWEPGSPFLYDLKFTLTRGNEKIDELKSYFGLRSVSIDGRRILINGKLIFQRLILDQGFYPEGVWTAPSDEALKHDIEMSIACGFNGARLHQKVFEPRFLYWADKLGYLVWGEFPNWGYNGKPEGYAPLVTEWTEVLLRDRNHPAIIGWCPFNETQAAAGEIQQVIWNVTKAVDPTRPVLETSGWAHTLSHPEVRDAHDYDGDPVALRKRWMDYFDGANGKPSTSDPPKHTAADSGVPFMISELGGIGWATEGGWGYGKGPKTPDEFYARYRGTLDAVLDNPNLFGFCYTQLTDVEQEHNGLYYYDRRPKFDVERIRAITSRKAAYERRTPAATQPAIHPTTARPIPAAKKP